MERHAPHSWCHFIWSCFSKKVCQGCRPLLTFPILLSLHTVLLLMNWGRWQNFPDNQFELSQRIWRVMRIGPEILFHTDLDRKHEALLASWVCCPTSSMPHPKIDLCVALLATSSEGHFHGTICKLGVYIVVQWPMSEGTFWGKWICARYMPWGVHQKIPSLGMISSDSHRWIDINGEITKCLQPPRKT